MKKTKLTFNILFISSHLSIWVICIEKNSTNRKFNYMLKQITRGVASGVGFRGV